MDELASTLSAYDFDILHKAFKSAVQDGLVAPSHKKAFAVQLLAYLTGMTVFDPDLIECLIGDGDVKQGTCSQTRHDSTAAIPMRKFIHAVEEPR